MKYEYETLPNVRVPPEMKERLNKYCEMTGADISATVRLALDHFLVMRLAKLEKEKKRV